MVIIFVNQDRTIHHVETDTADLVYAMTDDLSALQKIDVYPISFDQALKLQRRAIELRNQVSPQKG